MNIGVVAASEQPDHGRGLAPPPLHQHDLAGSEGHLEQGRKRQGRAAKDGTFGGDEGRRAFRGCAEPRAVAVGGLERMAVGRVLEGTDCDPPAAQATKEGFDEGGLAGPAAAHEAQDKGRDGRRCGQVHGASLWLLAASATLSLPLLAATQQAGLSGVRWCGPPLREHP